MTEHGATTIAGISGGVLESPVWDDRRNCLWLVDIPGRVIFALDPARDRVERHRMPSEPGSLALAEDGALVVALRDRVARFDPARGTLDTLARADHDAATTRFNDGRCDRQGRFWVGSMYEPRGKASAKLYRLDRDRLVPVLDGLTISNGLAFAADGRGAYHADTPTRTVQRFDLDPATGALSNRRAFIRFDDDGRPDGATLDADGGYWVATIDAGEVRRYRPDGTLDRRVAVPTPWPTMPAFAGVDYTTMYVTSLREGRDAKELAAHPHSGGLFRLRLDRAGLPEPRVKL